MKGKAFEKLCLQRMTYEERLGVACMWRNGVMTRWDDKTKSSMAIASLPDFSGMLDGLSFMLDAKVCSQASVNLQPDHFGTHQFKHLCRVARFGGTAFLLIHFPERVLKTKTDEVRTVAFPVHADHPFWIGFGPESGNRTINREACDTFGVDVHWDRLGRMRTETPDIVEAVRELRRAEIDGEIDREIPNEARRPAAPSFDDFAGAPPF